MYVRTSVPFAILLISFALSPNGHASTTVSMEEELAKLKQDLGEVLQHLSDMREEHAAEIEALNKKVAELARTRPVAAPLEQGLVEADDLEALRAAAEAEAEKEAPAEKPGEEKVFKSGNLGLQALNPEISITGDLLGTYRVGDDVTDGWDWNFRNLGIHFEAYLDPYSRVKAAVPISPSGARLGEAYFTRFGVLPSLNVTLGKFRQQFGVVNRWHKHALDWFDFPLPLRYVFGEGGLNQTGASLDWSGPLGPLDQELMVQFTNGENPRIFGQNSKHRPSVLVHYRLYQDLSPSTYMELGATGLFGWNDSWQIQDGSSIDEVLNSQVYGVDFTVAWEPTAQMRYRNLEWRSEFYIVDKKIEAPDGSGTDTLRPWGAYSSLQAKVSRTVDLGVRLDFYQPEVKSYANLSESLSLFPLAVTDRGAERFRLGLFATWWQSPFARFRLGYAHESGSGMGARQDMVTLQLVFAAGPHKHERY
ncbi:MAG: hypothetical protein JRS35_07000 [Deltaproteobacteria bacterium]|nr:hypothetical protein [Deltaproteobacteria bacterium]